MELCYARMMRQAVHYISQNGLPLLVIPRYMRCSLYKRNIVEWERIPIWSGKLLGEKKRAHLLNPCRTELLFETDCLRREFCERAQNGSENRSNLHGIWYRPRSSMISAFSCKNLNETVLYQMKHFLGWSPHLTIIALLSHHQVTKGDFWTIPKSQMTRPFLVENVYRPNPTGKKDARAGSTILLSNNGELDFFSGHVT